MGFQEWFKTPNDKNGKFGANTRLHCRPCFVGVGIREVYCCGVGKNRPNALPTHLVVKPLAAVDNEARERQGLGQVFRGFRFARAGWASRSSS